VFSFLAILMRTQGKPTLQLLLGAAIGVFVFYRGFVMLQRKRLIENTPCSKVHSASMGLVEISGLACGPATMPGPISGMPCYFHRSLVWEWRQEGRDSKWVKVAEESAHLPFFLEDGTGRVLIDPMGAEMSIHCDYSEKFSQSLFSTNTEIPANISAFLTRHGVSSHRKIKVEEYCVKPKNALFVLGTLAENHTTYPTSPTITQSTGTPSTGWRFSFSKSNTSSASFSVGTSGQTIPATTIAKPPLDTAQQEKVTAALMKAGITNPAAWAAAGIRTTAAIMTAGGAAAAVAPAKNAAPQETFDLHPSAVLKKGTHNPAFFISWQSQREVIKSLGWKSAAMIWGGPALTLFCIYLLAAEFGWL